jgi:signal transduction histidine kinase
VKRLPTQLRNHPEFRYAFGIVVALLAIGSTVPLHPFLEFLPSPPFLLATLVVAWTVGMGPAVLVLVLGLGALYWFVPPLYSVAFIWRDVGWASMFLGTGLLIAWLAATRRRVEEERAALLAREQEARTAAETANRAKDEFLAVVGHELRNPLSAITTSVRLLDRIDTPDERAMHAREVIARQAGHIARLVEDLLEVNRVLAGKIRLDRQPIELGEAIRGCLATLSSAGKMERHALKVEVEPVWVDADPIRVEQIAVNLVENALKYTPPGGTIQVIVKRVGSEAQFDVQDSGEGIPAELLPRVFDLFLQGNSGSDRGGLGIGLTVVRRLVELHGGTVVVSSGGPGCGSQFTVRLPSMWSRKPA